MENKKTSTASVLIKPVLVLFVIAVIVSALLAYVNQVTSPIIAANEKKVADAARKEVLAEADGFTKVDYNVEGVQEVYKANNGVGFVITATAKGYGGQLPVMVGISADGKITRVKIMTNNETPGLGKKVEADSFTNQFKGLGTGEENKVTAISGATISSKATMAAVHNAFEAYNKVKGGA